MVLSSMKICFLFFSSPNVNMTGRRLSNPLVKMDIKWTSEMANDLRKYQSKVDTLIPGCWLYSGNITSIEVSIF